MNLSKTYFQVLTLLSHVSQVGAANDGVTPCTSTWISGATSIRSISPYLSVPKMSYAILIDVTLV
jgi:hypothetical protein